MGILLACISVHGGCLVPTERPEDPPELQLQMAVSYQVGPEEQPMFLFPKLSLQPPN